MRRHSPRHLSEQQPKSAGDRDKDNPQRDRYYFVRVIGEETGRMYDDVLKGTGRWKTQTDIGLMCCCLRWSPGCYQSEKRRQIIRLSVVDTAVDLLKSAMMEGMT